MTAEELNPMDGAEAGAVKTKKKAKKAPAKAKAPKKAKASGTKDYTKPVKREGAGVGHFIRECINAGKMDNAAILTAVKKKFPDSKAKTSDVSWNRYMIKQGKYPS